MSLAAAYQGYEYQDLLTAVRLVDVMLGSITAIYVDQKFVPDDRFDDLTTIDDSLRRERVQIKHTESDDRPIALTTFARDTRSLRLDRIIAAAIADRHGPGKNATESSFRIVLRDLPPSNSPLVALLAPARRDPGPFLPGLASVRMRFCADTIWEQCSNSADARSRNNPLPFLQLGDQGVSRTDLEWFCEHVVVECGAPAASFDLTKPGAAEHLLLRRVQVDVGAGMYPNAGRSPIDVAESLIGSARAARRGALTVTASELLRRAQLRSDFGAVARSHPVDRSIEVRRQATVEQLLARATYAADNGHALLLVGPPGQGKSWICQQMLKTLSDEDWLVAGHYCYLGDADAERLPRVRAQSVFGSLLGRLAEHDGRLVSSQRPLLAADATALETAVRLARQNEPDRRIALVVDGLDHVTRVLRRESDADPSLKLAEALAALALPLGTTLIVLSQPGSHLEPLERATATTFELPGLTDDELRNLATRHGLLNESTPHPRSSAHDHMAMSPDDADELFAVLSQRSAGNALYATYLCREALRCETPISRPTTLRRLPPFDGSLQAYYTHIHSSLGDPGAWVADVIALLDFPISRHELKQIRPAAAHRVDAALEVLRPVLLKKATDGGFRVYHESFARFLRMSFQDHEQARRGLLNLVIEWLEGTGLFEDSRAFRHLVPLLYEAGYDDKILTLVDRDFVITSIASWFPTSAVLMNLTTAIDSAARMGSWPTVVRLVEMSRSVETYQSERFETTAVSFVDVVVGLLGADTVSRRLLHDGHPVMSGRSGIQVCAALDELGATVPWNEYMTAFRREQEADIAHSGAGTDGAVYVAWLRGRFRLAALSQRKGHISLSRLAPSQGTEDPIPDPHAPLPWGKLASDLDKGLLPARNVVDALLDTLGPSAVTRLIEKLASPGAACLAVAEAIAAGLASDPDHDVLYWANRAAAVGVPPGCVHRLMALGVDVLGSAREPLDGARERLHDLTRQVQDSSVESRPEVVGEWLDACFIAARNDSIGLASAEAMIGGPGWYTCWLRFAIALLYAEAESTGHRSLTSLNALRILTEVQNPFVGKPRACDLYRLNGLIEQSIHRAIILLDDDDDWQESLRLLELVSGNISTSLFGALGGPLASDRLLHLIVDTSTPERHSVAQTMLETESETGSAGRYYSDLAEYQLLAARLSLRSDDSTGARRRWREAIRLLVAYGVRKDATIYELLDSLPELVAFDSKFGRSAVARLQPLCERIPQHTDGKGTYRVPGTWWQLLAASDPCALAKLVYPRLLSNCNDPDGVLHGARSDLWRAWHSRADPVIAGALRLTLEEALEQDDCFAFRKLVETRGGEWRDPLPSLTASVLARADERPFEYPYTDDSYFLERDRKYVATLNETAQHAKLPPIAPLPTRPVQAGKPDNLHNQHGTLSRAASWTRPVVIPVRPGAEGIGEAIRVWQRRRYGEAHPDWSLDRFANILGYRILELVENGQDQAAETALELVADASGMSAGSELLSALADGFERHAQYRLAAIAHTLTWTRIRGDGGWSAFGGTTGIESLQRAAQIDRPLVLETIANEVRRVVSHGLGTLGIARALICGFARGGLGTGCSSALDIWDEAFAAIADRVPRVSEADDPDPVYVTPDADSGADIVGDLNVAFAEAAIAGLAHPGREQKRRSLMAVQVLVEHRTPGLGTALASALSSLSDPTTLTWLLRVLELSGEKAAPILSECRTVLAELTGRPHLIVRVLARRLVPGDAPGLALCSEPDPELLERVAPDLLLPSGAAVGGEDVDGLNRQIDDLAGVRLSEAEQILPHLGKAVVKRVATARFGETQQHRLRAQLRAYEDSLHERWPDAFLANEEALEDAIQRAAAGARGARLMSGAPVVDPVELENSLAEALLSDPDIPLALERTRQPRPEIPPPPFRGDSIWSALSARAQGAALGASGIEAAAHDGTHLCGTVAIAGSGDVPSIAGGTYRGWRLIATFERRIVSRDEPLAKEEDLSQRCRSIELRLGEDRQMLTLPPFAKGDLQAWNRPQVLGVTGTRTTQSQGVIGADFEFPHHGLGIQRPLLTPTAWLYAAITPEHGRYFSLDDDSGPALALISWRTEYETSEYHLARPLLFGVGLVARTDVFDRLVDVGEGNLTFRDFVAGVTHFEQSGAVDGTTGHPVTDPSPMPI